MTGGLPDHSTLRRRLTSAHFYLDRLHELIRKVSSNDFSSTSSQALLDLIERIADKLGETLEDNKQYLDAPTMTNVRLLLEHTGIAVDLVRLVRYIEPTSVDIVPWSLVAQLERLCRRFDWSIHIIVRPHFEFSYDQREVVSELKEIVQGHTEMMSLLDKQSRFVLLSFPRGEQQNMLQQALWGHEISHILEGVLVNEETAVTDEDQHYISSGGSLSKYLVKRYISDIEIELQPLLRFRNRHAIHVDANEMAELDLADDVAFLQASEDVWEVIYFWASEIVCDILALRIFGPAALFAFAAITETTSDLITPTRTHPPSALRLRLMVEELQELGFFDIDGDWTKWYGTYGTTMGVELTRILNLVKDFGTETKQKRDENFSYDDQFEEMRILCQIAEELLAQRLDKICAHVRSVEWEGFLSPESLQTEVVNLAECLEKEIPPNKWQLTPGEDPASLPGILNVGWAFWLKSNEQFDPESPLSEVNQINEALRKKHKTLNKLILKAIEASETQLQFAERKRLFAFYQEGPAIP